MLPAKIKGVEVACPKVVVPMEYRAPIIVEVAELSWTTMLPEPRMFPATVRACEGELVPMPV